MIRAVVNKGVIQPLEPLPPEWLDGHEVMVEEPEIQSQSEVADMEQWSAEMKILTAALDDSKEWEQIEATLADADRQSKDYVRREMD